MIHLSDFHENLEVIHNLLKGIIQFLLIFSTFLNRYAT